jgi:hypothetical protein
MYGLREQCLKKRGKYASLEEAQKRLDWFISKGIHKPGEMLPYQCPNCGKWHLGHDPGLRDKEKNEFLNFMAVFKVKKH